MLQVKVQVGNDGAGKRQWCGLEMMVQVTSSHSGALLCLPAGVPGSPPHCWRPSRSPRRYPSPCQQTRQSGIWHMPVPLDPVSRHCTFLHVV